MSVYQKMMLWWIIYQKVHDSMEPTIHYGVIRGNWRFAYDVIKNIIMQIMTNLI